MNLREEAKKLVNEFALDTEDGIDADNIIELYEDIVKLAETHAEAIRYEAEETISGLMQE